MTLGEIMASRTLKATQLIGIEATLIDPRGAYSTSGTVAESPLEYPVWASDLRDESERWADAGRQDAGITATVYVPAKDVTAKPKPGWRLNYGDRVFAVIAVLPSTANGMVYQWRLDIGEVAA